MFLFPREIPDHQKHKKPQNQNPQKSQSYSSSPVPFYGSAYGKFSQMNPK